ncbi:Adaptin ear-binding coat-associated protein 1 [Taenia crassiceps]|uniref:Adaptin ear-binding coat-associated protein 1 n=1 Tax=Taenia crassiceps TaxID=6207 RepID=A0ABR4QID2_9CEST
MVDSDYESVLLVKREVFLYTLPPRQSTRGYRAAEWSLDAPTWTGRLRVVTRSGSSDSLLYIRLEDAVSGRLYAQCPVEAFPSVAVEQVLDSSRYFVIRLVSDDGRTVFVGIGFAERSDAFDLNVAIQDHFKHCKQAAEAEKFQAELASDQNLPKLDLGLKEGQRLRLNLNTRRSGDASEGSGGSGSGRTRPLPSLKLGAPTGVPGLLPPPPPAGGGGRNRQSLRGTVVDAPAPASITQPISQPTSNVDLLAGLFPSAPAPAPTVPVNAQNPNDFSLI